MLQNDSEEICDYFYTGHFLIQGPFPDDALWCDR